MVNLAYHKEVAERLRAAPDDVLAIARDNLRRWLANYEPGEGRCFEEWRDLLDRCTLDQLVAIITEDSDEGQRLRQSTPFAGILSLEERREIVRRCEEKAVV